MKHQEITVTRAAAGTWVAGQWVPGADKIYKVLAVVQPASGRDQLILDEALRTREIIVLYTRKALQTTNEKGSQTADVVGYRGSDWQVQHVESWDRTGLPHFKVLASKVERS